MNASPSVWTRGPFSVYRVQSPSPIIVRWYLSSAFVSALCGGMVMGPSMTANDAVSSSIHGICLIILVIFVEPYVEIVIHRFVECLGNIFKLFTYVSVMFLDQVKSLELPHRILWAVHQYIYEGVSHTDEWSSPVIKI